MLHSSANLTIRCGLEPAYEAVDPTRIVLLIQPRLEKDQRMEGEQLSFSPEVSVEEYADVHRNIVRRFELPVGRTTITHDCFVAVPARPERHDLTDLPLPVCEMSPELLRYTLPSRYCDSDALMDFAFQHFGQVPHGLRRVEAICDWIHAHIEYRWGAGSPLFTASQVLAQRIHIASGFDAVDCAFSTLYGTAQLAWFSVWNYPVDRTVVKLGAPVDLAHRLDGTTELRFPAGCEAAKN